MTGHADILVRTRPSVAVVATGNELVSVAETPGPGQIRNSNSWSLSAQALEAGGSLFDRYHALDNRAAVHEVIEAASEADVLVFSGGVSVGRYDLVKDVLEEAGLETLFWSVRQRPGKPLLYGLLNGKPVFGLPGNPVSSSICFDQYVRPAIAVMMGRESTHRRRWPARLGASFPKPAGLHVFARGIASSSSDGIVVSPTGHQGSNLLTSLDRADCIVHLPADLEIADEGTPVEIEWYPGSN
jgi:molybdopterin molybdotransferase